MIKTIRTPVGKFELLVDSYQLDLLRDVRRVSVFTSMVAEVVEGTFADLGAGTGPLSVVAAHAGAERVIAVEKNPKRARLLEKNLRKHVPRDVEWEVVIGDAQEVDVNADVVACEMIDTLLLEEKFVPVINTVLEKYEPNIVPQEVRIGANPIGRPPRTLRYRSGLPEDIEPLEVIRTDKSIPEKFEYETPEPGYEFFTWVEYGGTIAGGSDVFCPVLELPTPGDVLIGVRGAGLTSLRSHTPKHQDHA
ncbi:RsmD family RNA methyltransferase [Methanopyrus sp. KOL6]|uniref:RsmD family RNA methyltransferase n=1 Tax=Methanopyrus sp. KOL6 TaxID=1937004 RepID=UPI000B4BEA03|nr:RsmD family RNA methyltransferase [Methanopyrus sp. KOL6]